MLTKIKVNGDSVINAECGMIWVPNSTRTDCGYVYTPYTL